MTRFVVLAAALLAALAAPAVAADRWTPVRGTIPGYSVAAVAADGPRTIVATLGGRRDLLATTIGPAGGLRRERVARMESRAVPRFVQIAVLPGGAAVIVWQDLNALRASVRPGIGRPFGPPRVVDPRPGAIARGAALARAGDRAVVAWWGGPSGGRLGIHASEMGADRRWTPPQEISAGTYPALPSPSFPPIVGIAAAGAPDGSAGVVWRQPVGPLGAGETRILAARRDASGAWSAPVVLRDAARVTLNPLSAAVSGDGVTGAWGEARRLRPDGVASETCLVAGTARGAGADVADLECRAGYDTGRTTLVPDGAGGLLAAWTRGPDPPPFRTSITSFARPAAGGWSAGTLAVAEARGSSRVTGAVSLPRGGALLGVQYGIPPRPREYVGALVLGDDGRVTSRIRGPRTPAVPRTGEVVLQVVGPRRAIVLTGSGGSPWSYRASLMRLSSADLE